MRSAYIDIFRTTLFGRIMHFLYYLRGRKQLTFLHFTFHPYMKILDVHMLLDILFMLCGRIVLHISGYTTYASSLRSRYRVQREQFGENTD